MQFPMGPGRIQILRVQVKRFANGGRLLELHQGDADALDLFRREGFFFEAPDGLAFHELADEFDKAEDELDDRALDIVGIRIPTQGSGGWGT